MRWTLAALLALALAGAVPSQPTSYGQALPIIAQRAAFVAPPALPASADIALPFTVLDSDDADLGYLNGVYYFTAYRVDAGDLNGGWDLAWDGVSTAAVAVGQIGASDGREGASQPRTVTPLGKVCSSRIGQFFALDGQRYATCFPSTSGRARSLHIERRPEVQR